MARRLTSEDVVKEIEFELAVGAVGQDELGQAIQAVQKYHNKLRGEAFEEEKLTPSAHAALSRQLQFNDAVLTILREAAEEIRSLQLAQRNLTQLPPDIILRPESVSQLQAAEYGRVIAGPGTRATGSRPDFQRPDAPQIERCMTGGQLEVPLQAERARFPLLGGLLTRLRLAAHRLSLFYTQRLAERQVEVNRVYGDALLKLMAQSCAQEEEIRSLRAQLAASQVSSSDSSAHPG